MAEARQYPLATPEQMDRVGLPPELRARLTRWPLELVLRRVGDDGTLTFFVPNKSGPYVEAYFNWHPEDPTTWHLEGQRFYAVLELLPNPAEESEGQTPVLSEHEYQAPVTFPSGDPDHPTVQDLLNWLDQPPEGNCRSQPPALPV